MPEFDLVTDLEPAGDQPEAIAGLVNGIERGDKFQTLLGITGSGKSFTIANVIAKAERPTLVLAPNKSLAAQLAAEFREMFPRNRVEYFVSYYDYYQPEAYIPSSDTYIEKDSSINDEIDRLRHSATSALLTRRDVIIVASVSAIYGLGSPEMYSKQLLMLSKGEERDQRSILRRLVELQYERNDFGFTRNKFRVRGDTIEVFPAYEERAVRIQLFGDEVERMCAVDPLTGEVIEEMDSLALFPASHYTTDEERLKQAIGGIETELFERLAELEKDGKLLEAQRLRMRTTHDLEMLREVGSCSGVENYSMHLDARVRHQPPYTLLDYFPKTGCAWSTNRTSRSRSCTASSRATSRARKRWLRMDSGCRRRWTTGRCGSRSSRNASTRSCSSRRHPATTNVRSPRRSSSRSCARPA